MKTTNETEMVTIGDGFTPEAAKSIGHLKNKQRPNVMQKYRYQCQSLVKKKTSLTLKTKFTRRVTVSPCFAFPSLGNN